MQPKVPTALDLRRQQGPNARSQKRKFPNAFSSYQPLSFWTQTVYFLVLRGRRVGHPAGCESTSPPRRERRSGNAGSRVRGRRLSAQLHPERGGSSPRTAPRRHRTRPSRGGGALPASRLGRGRRGVTQVAPARVGAPGAEERPSPRAPPPTAPPPSALHLHRSTCPPRPLCAPLPASQLRGYQSRCPPPEGGVRGRGGGGKQDPSRPRPQARGGQVERLWEKKAGGVRDRAGQGSAWGLWGAGPARGRGERPPYPQFRSPQSAPPAPAGYSPAGYTPRRPPNSGQSELLRTWQPQPEPSSTCRPGTPVNASPRKGPASRTTKVRGPRG